MVYCLECAEVNLLRVLCNESGISSRVQGTREITFSDPSAASSAQSTTHCRVVRRLVEWRALPRPRDESAIGRNSKPKDASEMCTSLENRLRMSSG